MLEMVGIITGIIAAVFVVVFGGRGLIDLVQGLKATKKAKPLGAIRGRH